MVKCRRLFFILIFGSAISLLSLSWLLIDSQPKTFHQSDKRVQWRNKNGYVKSVGSHLKYGLLLGYSASPLCPCVREGFEKNMRSNKQNPSTCSDFSTQRGKGQKVVSYAYYNPTNESRYDSFHSQKYLNTLLDRANEVKRYYPDWIMRIYHNVSMEDEYGWEVLCELFCEHDHVDLCDVRDIPSLGNFAEKHSGSLWRFIVMGDPIVNIFVSRDSDSIIQPREAEAVEEWLKSDKTFHVMRDHPNHRAVMLAGLWGCKNGKRITELATQRDNIFKQLPNSKYGYDQYVLGTEVWRLAKKDVLQHDSFNCKMKSHTNSLPFPTKRENNFYVGWGPLDKDKELKLLQRSLCPIECRPAKHKDWEIC